MDHFLKRKKDCLRKQDKSSIGSFDKKILGLCEKINKLENYYTLSSCSGRIVLIKDIDKKISDMFVFKSHDKIKVNDLTNALENYSGKENLVFKIEPCILHVACRSLVDANKMLTKARYAGWKNSGIMSIADSRIVLEMRSTESIALLILVRGKIIVDDNYLKVLIAESNRKLGKTWKKIENLEKNL